MKNDNQSLGRLFRPIPKTQVLVVGCSMSVEENIAARVATKLAAQSLPIIVIEPKNENEEILL